MSSRARARALAALILASQTQEDRMTPHQFQSIRKSAGLTRQQAADYLGVTLRSIYRYESGEHAISPQSAKLMEML